MASNKLTIINAHVIDPASKLDGRYDIVVEDGKISECHPCEGRDPDRLDSRLRGNDNSIGNNNYDESTINASGLLLTPGFIDLHVHLREPGFEYKEDIESGTKAALKGGFTTIFCMPNTKPAIHNVKVVRQIQKRVQEVSPIDVQIVGAITKDIAGNELVDFDAMANAGVIAFSDDGNSVSSKDVMKKAFEIATKKNLLIISHPEDKSISKDGVINDGAVAKKLGLPGIPEKAEKSIIERDIKLAEETGARLHIAHVSTATGIELVRAAKKRGVKVTCEVTPHHLLLTEDDIEACHREPHEGRGDPQEIASPTKGGLAMTKTRPCDNISNLKMNPPLRTEKDRQALIDGINDGTVDCIATDHAPHETSGQRSDLPAMRAKARQAGIRDQKKEFIEAPFGVIGMESAFPVCMKLVEEGKIELKRLIELFTSGPARVVGIDKGKIGVGSVAEFLLHDINAEFKLDVSKFVSKSRNCP
ncbi:dihydroorotase, partial [bacterium]|nr:dihydroorotase [bacterium]